MESHHLGSTQIGERFTDCHATRGGRVNQRQGASFPQGHRFPCLGLKTGGRDPNIGDRNLPAPNHLVTCHEAPNGTITNMNKEALIRDGRIAKHA